MTDTDPARLEKHSVQVAGHGTSITLEAIFWRYLKDVARRDGRSINDLVTEIDAHRTGNLSSALRVALLKRALGSRTIDAESYPE
jgi:predicted DNA-binding ribbon-helix-helix protein